MSEEKIVRLHGPAFESARGRQLHEVVSSKQMYPQVKKLAATRIGEYQLERKPDDVAAFKKDYPFASNSTSRAVAEQCSPSRCVQSEFIYSKQDFSDLPDQASSTLRLINGSSVREAPVQTRVVRSLCRALDDMHENEDIIISFRGLRDESFSLLVKYIEGNLGCGFDFAQKHDLQDLVDLAIFAGHLKIPDLALRTRAILCEHLISGTFYPNYASVVHVHCASSTDDPLRQIIFASMYLKAVQHHTLKFADFCDELPLSEQDIEDDGWLTLFRATLDPFHQLDLTTWQRKTIGNDKAWNKICRSITTAEKEGKLEKGYNVEFFHQSWKDIDAVYWYLWRQGYLDDLPEPRYNTHACAHKQPKTASLPESEATPSRVGFALPKSASSKSVKFAIGAGTPGTTQLTPTKKRDREAAEMNGAPTSSKRQKEASKNNIQEAITTAEEAHEFTVSFKDGQTMKLPSKLMKDVSLVFRRILRGYSLQGKVKIPDISKSEFSRWYDAATLHRENTKLGDEKPIWDRCMMIDTDIKLGSGNAEAWIKELLDVLKHELLPLVTVSRVLSQCPPGPNRLKETIIGCTHYILNRNDHSNYQILFGNWGKDLAPELYHADEAYKGVSLDEHPFSMIKWRGAHDPAKHGKDCLEDLW